MGFRHRLALFLVVALAAVQILTGFAAYSYLRHSLVEKEKVELGQATQVFLRQLSVLSERVGDDVQVLSLDYALRQAIAQHDYDTELSALRNHGHRVGATRMMLVGLDGAIAADTGAVQAPGKAFAYSELLDDSNGERTALATLDGKIYWIVVVPVRAPVAIAFIAACVPIDDALLGKLSALSETPRSIALATRGTKGKWEVAARTENGPRHIPLPGKRATDGTSETSDFLTVTAVLKTASHSAPVIAVLGYPMAEAFAAYRSIVPPMLLVLALALILAAGAAMLVVRRASKPLEALAATARRIAGGDYTAPAPVGAKDEIGQLSQAIIGMTGSIADREAALTSMIGALETARNDAVKANEAKSQFLANMSHELRTPLNAIVGFGDMLRQEILGPLGVARYREYAGDICASGERLLSLVSRMLDLAEVEKGTLAIARGRVAPQAILQQAVAAVRPAAGAVAVAVEAGDLDEIEADADKLRQALTSVLHNAVKVTPQGGTVRVSARRDAAMGKGGALVIRIEDRGPGLEKSDIEVVTRPFHRLRSALDGQHQGAGLGLPFAKAIIELHGGALSIESEKGHGTTVEIRLPVAARAMSDAA
ncbi:MAG: HAMP domain-containing histidine kinase [Alphaproteobacteria bacterium]|nr:HAMP domain-containing histidine kinase [Alphaproteobacteria bacterium]